MADNVTIAGASWAADEVTRAGETVYAQCVKQAFGADGSYNEVSANTPLPVNAMLSTATLQNGTTQLTPKFAVINLTATGTLVAAVTDKKIRVISLVMSIEMNDGDETYTFKSGAAGTALTGALGDQSAAGVTFVFAYPFSPVGHFETAAGALLELSLAGTTPNAQGSLVYVEV